MRRKLFLKEFLGALGAKYINWTAESATSTSGSIEVRIVDDGEETDIYFIHE